MKKKKSAYAKAGVDIAAAERAVELMKKSVRSTFNKNVLADIGLFGGLLDASSLKKVRHPVLVFSIDGVGTKMKVAQMMNIFDTIGQCLVNHCVNDILAQGAAPLAFLDYVASDKLKPEILAQIVWGIATACKSNAAGFPIIGGETAEMPGTYGESEHDLVGAIAGVVEKEYIINGTKIEEGDLLIGLRSNGLHTNGYSLAREVFFKTLQYDVGTYIEMFNCTLGEELLKIHKNYSQCVAPLLKGGFDIHGIAHITGGGFYDNIGRLLPDGLCAEIPIKWKIPPVFELIQRYGDVSDKEMREVFNLGIGMVLIVPFEQVKAVRGVLAECGERDHLLIGTIIKEGREHKGQNVYFKN